MKNMKNAVEPFLVDVPTACDLLSVKKTKLFEMLRPGGGLHRVKFGGKTLVTMDSIKALAGQGGE